MVRMVAGDIGAAGAADGTIGAVWVTPAGGTAPAGGVLWCKRGGELRLVVLCLVAGEPEKRAAAAGWGVWNGGVRGGGPRQSAGRRAGGGGGAKSLAPPPPP